VVPYALTHAAEPLLLLSNLAEHTRNLHADPRASLLIVDSAARDDPQAGARLTLLGTIEPVDEAAMADTRERYTQRHPGSVDLLALADFRFFVLRPAQARFIAGFGDMGWLDAADLLRARQPSR
jgi:putative heme iron utilization protein